MTARAYWPSFSQHEATPEAYREKGRFTPPDPPRHANKSKAWAYPVVANGRLCLRDQDLSEFYHLAADPYEMSNVFDRPAHADVQARITAEITAWQQRTGDALNLPGQKRA